MRALVLLALLVLGGCERYRLLYDSPLRDAEVVRENNILAAKIRRAQVIAEIGRINYSIRFTRVVENRIVLEQARNDLVVELDRLNSIAAGSLLP
jgi:hypothetical protein